MEVGLNLMDRTRGAERFTSDFELGLSEIVRSRKGQHPGMAITAMSNLSVLGQEIPASVFNGVDFSLGFEVPDDALVFGEAFKRIHSGLVEIEKPERQKVGEFVFQYNLLRGFRPKRSARASDVALDAKFNPAGFHYGKQEADPEVFATSKESRDLTVDFIYNRYAFAPYHFLFVPNRSSGHNQFIDPDKDKEIIESAWQLVHDKGLGKGVRLCYNSLGAHASVNHLHLQGFFLVDGWNLPIDRHLDNGDFKKDDFYMGGASFVPEGNAVQGLTTFIKDMNERHKNGERVSYSYYMSPKGIVCFPRKHQGDPTYLGLLGDVNSPESISTGFAFYEMLGEILTPRKLGFNDQQSRNNAGQKVRKIFGALELGAKA
jgi:hypothetical protein